MKEEEDTNIQPATNEEVMNAILTISQETALIIQRISKEFVSLIRNSKGKAIVWNDDSDNA